MVGVGYLDTTGLAVGLKKGFLVEKRKLAARPASRKGVRTSCSLFLVPVTWDATQMMVTDSI
jgi:hypothetical protein